MTSMVLAAVVVLAAANIRQTVGSGLDEGFHAPPAEARSRTWWHWQDGFLDADQMERELKFMREAGLGGCQAEELSPLRCMRGTRRGGGCMESGTGAL